MVLSKTTVVLSIPQGREKFLSENVGKRGDWGPGWGKSTNMYIF